MNDTTTRPTSVVNVSGLTRARRAALEADPSFAYVGRAFAGWPASVYGNPFKHGMSASEAIRIMDGAAVAVGQRPGLDGVLTADQAVACYRACWTATRKRREKIRAEMRSRTLGCWCVEYDGVREPERPCHAVELARIADSEEIVFR